MIGVTPNHNEPKYVKIFSAIFAIVCEINFCQKLLRFCFNKGDALKHSKPISTKIFFGVAILQYFRSDTASRFIHKPKYLYRKRGIFLNIFLLNLLKFLTDYALGQYWLNLKQRRDLVG